MLWPTQAYHCLHLRGFNIINENQTKSAHFVVSCCVQSLILCCGVRSYGGFLSQPVLGQVDVVVDRGAEHRHQVRDLAHPVNPWGPGYQSLWKISYLFVCKRYCYLVITSSLCECLSSQMFGIHLVVWHRMNTERVD